METKDRNDERWITAVHEAGHAVVGLHHGAIVDFAEVLHKPEFGTGRLGGVLFGLETEEGELPTLAAGRLAEFLVIGGKPDQLEAVYLHGLASDSRAVQVSAMRTGRIGCDQLKIMRKLTARGVKDTIAAFHRIEKSTWRLVQELAPEIMAVANALYARGRLSHDEIGWIIADVQEGKPAKERRRYEWFEDLIPREELRQAA